MDINQIIREYINYQNQELFILMLFFIFIFALVFVSMKKIKAFEKERATTAIISLIIATLGAFYMSNSQILAIIATYNALGFLMAFMIPFIIYLAIIHKLEINFIIRAIALGGFLMAITYFQNKNNLYNQDIFTSLVIIIIIGAIVLDKPIHRIMNKPKKK